MQNRAQLGYVELKSLEEAQRYKEIEKQEYGPTKWLAGKTPEEIAKEKEEAARKARILRLEQDQVSNASKAQIAQIGAETANAISSMLPPNMKQHFEKAKATNAHTVEGMPHLAYTTVGRYPTPNGDGTFDYIVLYTANFCGEIGEKDGQPTFSKIPDQRGKTSKDNTPMFYAYRCRQKADGSLGDLNTDATKGGDGVVFKEAGQPPVITSNGIVYNPANKAHVKRIAEHVYRNIHNTMMDKHNRAARNSFDISSMNIKEPKQSFSHVSAEKTCSNKHEPAYSSGYAARAMAI